MICAKFVSISNIYFYSKNHFYSLIKQTKQFYQRRVFHQPTKIVLNFTQAMLNSSQYSRNSFQKMNQRRIVVKKMPTKFRKMIINRANNGDRKFCTESSEKGQHRSIRDSMAADNQKSRLSERSSISPTRSTSSIKVRDIKASRLTTQSGMQDKSKQIRSFVKNMKSTIDKDRIPKIQIAKQKNEVQYPVSHSSSRQIQRKNKTTNSIYQDSPIRKVHSSLSQHQNSKNQRYANEQRLIKIEQSIDQIIRAKLSKFAQRQQFNHCDQRSKTSNIHYDEKQTSSNDIRINHSNKKIKQKVSRFKTTMDDTAEDLIQDISNQDLVRLVKQLILIKEQDQNLKCDQVIQILDKKIEMIQKIIAQNNLQSQAMKKYYFARLSQKKTSAKSTLKSLQSETHKLRPPTLIRNMKSIFLQSNTRRSYQAPKPSNYDLQRFRHKPFEYNIQPLPRSSYNRQYLKFSQLKYKNQSCKKNDSRILPEKDFYRHKSVYSSDFITNGKSDITNHKELDAFRDKFKNVNMYFNPQNNRQAQEISLKEKALQTIKIKQDLFRSNALRRRGNTLISDLAGSRKLQTQNHRSYKGINAGASIIKDKALTKLKYSFRQMTKI